MYSPLNKIEKININEIHEQKFSSYSEHIKEKYKLTNEVFNMLQFISLEEFIAIKYEQSLNLLNGTINFPLVQIYKKYVDIAYKNLFDFYTDNLKYKKSIMKSISYDRYRFFSIKRKKRK